MKRIKNVIAIIIAIETIIPNCVYAKTKNNEIDDNIHQSGNTYVTYNGDKVISSMTQGEEVDYVWDDNRLIGFKMNEIDFYYVRDEFSDMIIGVEDEDGNLICKYSYDEYGVMCEAENCSDELGEKVINSNKMLNVGAFFDESSGNYWYRGNEYDPDAASFIGVDATAESEYSLASIEQYGFLAVQYYNARVNNSSYKTKISYSTTWYNKTKDDIDLLTRLIYGEMGYNISGVDWDNEQRKAVAWVIFNRMEYAGSRFPDTLKGVCVQSGEFSTITGGKTDTAAARYDGNSTSTDSWKESLMIACYLYVSDSETVMSSLIKEPANYDGQLFFCSYNTYKNMSSATKNSIKNVSLTVGGVSASESRKNVFFNYKSI